MYILDDSAIHFESGAIRCIRVGASFHACPQVTKHRNAKRAGTEACPYDGLSVSTLKILLISIANP